MGSLMKDCLVNIQEDSSANYLGRVVSAERDEIDLKLIMKGSDRDPSRDRVSWLKAITKY